jgi:hypothetical protein
VVVTQRVEEPPDGATPLALPAAMQLKTLILGDSEGHFPSAWKEGGIVFTSNIKLGYGLELYKVYIIATQNKLWASWQKVLTRAYFLYIVKKLFAMVTQMLLSYALFICNENFHA